MPTIESYLNTAPVPQSAKADAWEAYQAPDHDSFKSALDKLTVPRTVKADMYEMRYGANSIPLAPIGKPADPILNGPEAQYHKDYAGYNGMLEGFDKPTIDLGKIPLYQHAFDPNSTSKASIVAQHALKFAADQTTPKNAAIAAGATVAGPLIGAGVEAAGPALGYAPEVAAKGADMAAQGAHRVLAGYFGAMGAKGTLDNYRKTVQDYTAGKPITGDVTDTVLNAGMSYLGGKGFFDNKIVSGEREPTASEMPLTPSSSPSPAVDSTPSVQGHIAPLQGQLFTDSTHSVPSAETEVPQATPGSQLDLLPMQGRLFSVKGEALPTQQAEAAPMSPEAEAISKSAESQASKDATPKFDGVSPKSPSVATTRLYHGSAEPGRYDGNAWFSTDKNYASNYRPGSELQYVDYPTNKLNALADPDETGQTPAKGFTFNGELHSDETGLRKPVEAKPTEGPLAQVVSDATEKVKSAPDAVSKLEDTIRKQTGQVIGLNHIAENHPINTALERAIQDQQQTHYTTALTSSPGISLEDQKLVSMALGEKVGSVLTEDQVEKAHALRGRIMAQEPQIQYRRGVSGDRLAASRDAMQKALDAPDTSEEQKAKLRTALEPDESGKVKQVLYEPLRKNVPATDLPADHPLSPFIKKWFGAVHPEISRDNYGVALGSVPRYKHMGMETPEQRAALKAMAPQATAEGEGTVNGNVNGFGYDTPNNPKGISGDAKQTVDDIALQQLRDKTSQIREQLRTNVKAYQSLRDPSSPSVLVDQLNKLDRSVLPKETKELVKPPKSKTSEAVSSPTPVERPTSAQKGDTTKATETPVNGKKEAVAKVPLTYDRAKSGVGKIVETLMKHSPEHMESVKEVVAAAADHYKEDDEGGMIATYKALRVYKQGILDQDDWALRNALKEVRRGTPAEQSMAVGARLRTNMGDGSTMYSGFDPTLGKSIVKDVAKSTAQLKQFISPKLTDHDMIVSSDAAANAYLSRYERMSPNNRAAYKADLFSDETTRKIAEGDPEGTKGYGDRLKELRQGVEPHGLYDRMKQLVHTQEDRATAADAKRVIQRANGYRAGNDVRTQELFNKLSTTLDGWSDFESREFTHKMEYGLDQGDGFKNEVASSLRKSLDDARDNITAVNGNFQEYLENYFPHIFANVGKGMDFARRQTGGMTGNEGFLKHREYETLNQGIAEGLSPISNNPVKQVLMRVEQMNRYAMKEEIAKDFISSGKAQLYKPEQSVPAGFTALQDPAFERAAGLGGKYYAPEAVASVFNNFVSHGLAGKLKIPLTHLSAYDALRATTNTMNQFELGLSGLHGTFTAVNSVISEQARGLASIVNGDVEGGIKTAISALNVPGRYLFGRNLIAHMKDPNTFQEMSSIADAFKRAGGRVGMDKVFGTAYGEKLQTSYKEAMDENLPTDRKAAAWARTVKNAVGTVLEKAAVPIMNHIVPNLKAGAFAMSAQEILAKHAGESSSFIDGELQKAWNNMDDRFGQPVYDNYFMNKVTKDIAMITMRSPGWNIGTFRAGAGGLLDLSKSIRDVTKGQRFKITDRTAYLGSLVATTMALNGVLNLAMTGSAPHGMDYFFARTGTKDANGEDNRLMPKLYTYDYMNLYHSPLTTALHKSSPLLGTLTDLKANKSFYGREIYDPGSSAGARLGQMATYMAKQYEPFSISNAQESMTRGDGLGRSILQSATGLLPAPKWAGRSDAENLAGEYHAATMAQGGQPGDVFDRRQKFVKLQAGIKNGSVTPEQLGKMVNSGEVPVSFLDHVFDQNDTPNLEKWTKSLSSPQQVMNIFDKATPEEKQRLIPIMIDKMDKLDPTEIPAWADKINAAQHHPDTHTFSTSRWKAGNPDGDEQQATAEATQKGYEVHQ